MGPKTSVGASCRWRSKADCGLAALKLGFALQLVCFGLFLVVSTRFLFVGRRWVTRPLRYTASLGASWARLNWAISAATIAITVGFSLDLFYDIRC